MNLRSIFSDQRPFYGQDPFVINFKGVYWLIESVDESKIAISPLNSLQNPFRSSSVVVWNNPDEQQVWAPEIHQIDGLWYIFYAFSDGNNSNHRPYVLRSERFLGPYKSMGMVGPDIWGIDMTTFLWQNRRYAVWSGWENNGDEFPQNLYIAEMNSPWSVGKRIKFSSPELSWEKSVAPILEGPQAWIRSRSLNILYSGNASWKQDYSTGILTLVGSNPLDPGDWKKRSDPVMKNAGHGMIVDNHFIFHRKLSAFPGWTDREICSINIKEYSPWLTRVK